MYIYEETLPTYSPKEVAPEIIAAVRSAMNANGIDDDHIYNFRTAPQTGHNTLSLTLLDAQPFKTPFQFGPYYDYLVDVMWPHNGTMEQLESAESAVLDIFWDFWSALLNHDTPKWKEIYTARSSYFPAAPVDNPNVRRLFIFIRVKPN